MADRGDDLFLFGDDFEAILDILDEDEVLHEQFSTAASEVSSLGPCVIPWAFHEHFSFL